GGGSFPLNELGYRENRPAREVSFSPPTVLDVDRDGNLYFSFNRGPDHMDHLYRISTDGQVSYFMNLDGGATALTIDPGNNLYVAIDFNRSGRMPRSSIERISPDGSRTHVAGNGLGPPLGTEPVPAFGANIDTYIIGLAAGPSGDLFFGNGRRIWRISGGIIHHFAGTGTAGFSGDGGPAMAAEIYHLGLATDPRRGVGDNLYLGANANIERVRQISPVGTITTVAGTGARGFSGDGGPATAAQFFLPGDVDLDDEGQIFISEMVNNRIRMIAADGRIWTIAGTGRRGEEEGNALESDIAPYHIAVWEQAEPFPVIFFSGNDMGRIFRLDCTPPASQADVTVSKTGRYEERPGFPSICYTVTVTNNGPATAEEVVITDTLSPLVRFSRVEAGKSGVSCENDGAEVRCTLARLDAEGRVSFDICAAVPPPVILNNVRVTAATGDPVPENNQGIAQNSLPERECPVRLPCPDPPEPIECPACPAPGGRTVPVEPICGNGIVEEGEMCDDGNLVNGDGCSTACKNERRDRRRRRIPSRN
ncbi:MAG: DUF11 domain-containing protein, partial [Deltaproteobacteria bacterium]|nr:DUF11 domain-containing protein [Deltaproteobacteria bacterium]